MHFWLCWLLVNYLNFSISFLCHREWLPTLLPKIWDIYNCWEAISVIIVWDFSIKVRTKGSCKLHVDAGGEDWRHWKNLLEIRFAKETTCLLFSMSDFPEFIITFICCVKQMKQELISWAHSSLFISIFEISKTG